MQTSQNTKKLKDFMIEFQNWSQQNGEIMEVKFFGSAIEKPNEWVWGKSDIDIFVFGNTISGETKKLAYKFFWELNKKYDLRLENVAALHPLIFFIDDLPGKREFYALFKLLGNLNSPEIRKILKEIMPKWKEINKLSLPDPLWKFV